MKGITAGTVITFGSYLQHSTRPSVPAPIEWFVLDTGRQTATLIARYGLEMIAYHDKQSNIS